MPTPSDHAEEQKKIIRELTLRMQRYEAVEQNLRRTQSKLDAQIDIFRRIHSYTQMAFRQEGSLYDIMAEGIVDIFQMELGAVYRVDFERNALVLLGSCNLEGGRELPLPEDSSWLALWSRSEVIAGEPVEDPLWEPLQLGRMIFRPLINNRNQVEGGFLGGVTKDSLAFYENTLEEVSSSFLVYCQQMNGISNNAEALVQARAAVEAKTRFLANLSHEIRTPMNAIIGMAQVARRSRDMDVVAGCVEDITGAAHQLLGLLNDVLDISRVEEGKLSLGREPFDLEAAMNRLAEEYGAQAAEKKQKLSLAWRRVAATALLGDEKRLSQIIGNLLSNAVKFTPEGGEIGLEVRQLKREGAKVLLRFSVSDTGIGIEPSMVDHVFTAFEQADGSASRKYGGTGLGLSISQRLAELMDSKLQVESQPGKGSRFSLAVWLDIDTAACPLDSLEEPGAGDLSQVDFSGCGVLVVDDVEINRTVVHALLEDTGLVLEDAANGQEAVDLFAASSPGQYRVILMDLQMPVMDGCTAVRAIRGLPREDAATVAIYAMTANAFQEDVQQVMEAGMDGHISKPVDYNVIMAHIAEAIRE